MTLEEWLADGRRVDVGGHKIFVRTGGAGPWLTLLHGFPTSSWDWAALVPQLQKTHRVLAFDWLGFGDSDKPNAPYTIFQQADLLEALWKMNGVTQTAILAHDYGDTVLEEMLARGMAGIGEALPPIPRDGVGAANCLPRGTQVITRATILNGSVYGALNRPLFIQQALQWPVLGALLTRFVSEREFGRNFRRIFGPSHPISDDDLHSHWLAITRHGGNRIYHRLVHHYGDQRRHGERWERALETTGVPLRFVWGMADPVSGAPIATRLRERIANVDLVALDGVGHYPHLEVPDVVVRETLREPAT